SVPSTLVFNESPFLERVFEAIDLGFGMVMYSEEGIDFDKLSGSVREVTARAHRAGCAVEGEVEGLAGLSGELSHRTTDLHLTDPRQAREFVEQTGIDALAVNVGQVHVHGREEIRLDLGRLAEIDRAIPLPLVLHGATSIHRGDVRSAIQLGVRKINVGS